MGFFDELRARNTASGGFNPSNVNIQDQSQSLEGALNTVMPFMHQMRNRTLEDYKAKTLFDNNIAMQQGASRRVFDPSAAQPSGQPNIQLGQDNITPYQQANLGLESRKLASGERSDAARLNLAKTVGDERQNLNEQRFGLEQTKNAQIYDTKMREMERKSAEAEQKLALATQVASNRQNDATSQNMLRQATIEAQDARHSLDLAQKDKELAETKRQHDDQVKNWKDQLEANGFTMQDTEIDASGNKRTVITKKGKAAQPAANADDPFGLRTK